jgi:UDP-N-acetylmuramoyl-tripeptide--D-alanyl-D-alanine ligase
LIDLSNLVSGELREELQVSGLSIDTRTLKKGDCFIAITGQNFDGHDFVQQALSQGANFAIVERIPDSVNKEQLILVDDSINALRHLARRHRQTFDIPVIALTGSCGKTTVKEMISHILDRPHLSTMGNFNNHLGVPLVLSKLNNTHQVAVLELGANHVGEILKNVALIQPSIALITNISEAHVGEFGGIDNIEKAKGEIFDGLSKDGTLLVNLDDPRVVRLASTHSNPKITFSCQDKQADLYAFDLVLHSPIASSFKLCYQGKTHSVDLPEPGEHSVRNALSALAAVVALGGSLNDAIIKLASFNGVKGRLQRRQTRSGMTLIDDTYNANVSSVLAAISVLSKCDAGRCLILGELAEAGESLPSHKEAILASLIEHNIEFFITVGGQVAAFPSHQGICYQHLTNKSLIRTTIDQWSENLRSILVKGSRCAKMEEVVELLIK